eukprot:GFUD01019373.1.p1 GENE.GFUD01019373.1~~GFUD01019373.1.p1  ORF type:complete len:658 (-),score=96.97 GFUD01019373.1:433-2406(-)
MIHVERLASGLQELLCEGSFVDVRICCSDHSPSDGLGAHRAMLAAASPLLLAPNLQSDEVEDEMICLHLPDYSSSCVASVLSILYYGETWLQCGDQVSAINSLLLQLGINLEVFGEGYRMYLRKKGLPVAVIDKNHPVKGKTIKKEPLDYNMPVSPAKIKKEKFEKRSIFPLVQTASLLKCPSQNCNFCSLSIPEIQSHIAECSSSLSPSSQSLEYVDVKPHALNLKREQLTNIKQEAIDPLEKKTELKAEKLDSIESDTISGNQSNIIVDFNENMHNSEYVDDLEIPEETSEIFTIVDDSCSEVGEKVQVQCEQDNCAYMTKSISSLKAHMIMHQRKDILKDFKKMCPVCSLNFRTLVKLKEHIQKHGTCIGAFTRCHVDNCQKNIDSKSFYDHVLYGHFGEQYKLKCDQCDFKATSTTKLKNHIMLHIDERPLKCPHCEKSFRNNPQLIEHVTILHSKNQPFSCTDCGLSFYSNAQLSKHTQTKHSNEIFSCQRCEKTFMSPQGLKSHDRNVHNKNQSKLICSSCGLKSGGCQCGKSTPESVACPVCGKQLLSKNLASHLHYHRQSALRPFICQECSQTFTHASSLKRHALIHSGKQQFVCEQCNKGFFQKIAYQTHCKSHTSERIHCKGCNQPFLTQYLLNFHLKSKSNCRNLS